MEDFRRLVRCVGMLLGLVITPLAQAEAQMEPHAQAQARGQDAERRLEDDLRAATHRLHKAERDSDPQQTELRLSLKDLGDLLLQARRYGEAREVFGRLLELQEAEPGRTTSEVGETLASLGRAAYLQGSAADAFPVLRRCASLKLQTLVQDLSSAGPEQRAPLLEEHRRFLALYLRVLTTLGTPEAAQALLASSLEEKGLLLRLTREARMGEQVPAKAQDTTSAPDDSEEESPEEEPAGEGSAPPSPLTLSERLALRKQAHQAISESAALERTWIEQGRPGKAAADVYERQVKLNEQATAIERQLAVQAEVLPEDVLAALRPGQVLVDYQVVPAFSEPHRTELEAALVAVVADPEATVPFTQLPLGTLAPVAKNIRAYLSSMESGGAGRSVDALAQSLYQQLWAPLGPSVSRGKTIFVVTDGLLQLTSFAGLMDEKGAFLTSRLEQLTSARDVVTAHALKREYSDGPVLLVAPHYSASQTTGEKPEAAPQNALETRGVGLKLSDLYFAELPGTATEGQSIYRAMSNWRMTPRLLTGDEASEKALRALRSPEVLHIATHGFFLKESSPGEQPATGAQRDERGAWAIRPTTASASPNAQASDEASTAAESSGASTGASNDILRRAGLALAGANEVGRGGNSSEQEDGILLAEEARALHLRETSLVVLSACQTALGGVSDGEGIYGLQRAFQEAGAGAVLATLWSVHDKATKAFMTTFYDFYLNRGLPPQQALFEARRQFRADHPEWQHPYYWAGFQLVGRDRRTEGTPIPEPTSQHHMDVLPFSLPKKRP